MYSVGHGVALGMRVAFDVNSSPVGGEQERRQRKPAISGARSENACVVAAAPLTSAQRRVPRSSGRYSRTAVTR